jgi:hypothetical protein
VRDDADVADVTERRCTGHCKVPFGFRELGRGNPGRGAIFRRRMVVKNAADCLKELGASAL